MGKETGWARPHFPSTLLSCGSPDSTRKASSWSRGFVRVATRYQMGKVEGKAVPGKGLFSAPAGGKGRRKFSACSCSLRRCSFSPHWAQTSWAWRLLKELEKMPSHYLWICTDFLFKKLDNTMVLFTERRIQITLQPITECCPERSPLLNGTEKNQVALLGEKRRRDTDTEEVTDHILDLWGK